MTYVDDVLAGRIPGNAAVGRALLDMVHSVPKMSAQEFEDMFTSNIKVINIFKLIKNEKLIFL